MYFGVNIMKYKCQRYGFQELNKKFKDVSIRMLLTIWNSMP